MRYYDVKIYKAGQAISAANMIREYTSYPASGTGNTNDPGALNILLDAYVVYAAAQAQQAALQIWGPPISDLMQANNFTTCQIEVYGGFQKGLPLNNQNQSGLILSGEIIQSFGNWQGTDMTLDFVIVANGTVAAQQNNIVLNWVAGTQLSQAIKAALAIAFPASTINVNISPKLVLNYTAPGAYPSLKPFAQTINALTKEIIGGSYQGVNITVKPGSIDVTDGTVTPSAVTQIAFQDLIGQPTWVTSSDSSLAIQFVCPMRADLSVGDYIQLPEGILGTANNGFGVPGTVTTTQGTLPAFKQQSIFKGKFLIIQVHHMGEFRSPDGQAWVTVFDATPVATQ
jgi:hypothetical protein